MTKRIYTVMAATLLLGGVLFNSIAHSQPRPSLGIKKPPRDYFRSFMNLRIDPKALGMGGAFLAQGDEAGNYLWNPGSLPYLRGTQTSLNFGQHKDNVRWTSIGIAGQNWGLGIVGLFNTKLPLPSLLRSLPK